MNSWGSCRSIPISRICQFWLVVGIYLLLSGVLLLLLCASVSELHSACLCRTPLLVQSRSHAVSRNYDPTVALTTCARKNGATWSQQELTGYSSDSLYSILLFLAKLKAVHGDGYNLA